MKGRSGLVKSSFLHELSGLEPWHLYKIEIECTKRGCFFVEGSASGVDICVCVCKKWGAGGGGYITDPAVLCNLKK